MCLRSQTFRSVSKPIVRMLVSKRLLFINHPLAICDGFEILKHGKQNAIYKDQQEPLFYSSLHDTDGRELIEYWIEIMEDIHVFSNNIAVSVMSYRR
jgi:hypothetical protein